MFYKRKKIINIDCLSYSGATWINLVLGSNNKSLYLGPPQKLFSANNDKLCLICEECELWKKIKFLNKNIISGIFKEANITHLFTNNANKDFKKKSNIFFYKTYEILLLRDGRAITLSFFKKNKKKINYFNSIHPNGWFYHSFQNLPDLNKYKHLVVKYENICLEPIKYFKVISDYVDIDFTRSQLKFWEKEHHLITGNQGPIEVIKNFQKSKKIPYRLSRENEKHTNAAAISKNFSKIWKKQITSEQRFFFDLILGEKNQNLGYERDHFTKKQVSKYLNLYKKRVVSGIFEKLPNEILENYLSK